MNTDDKIRAILRMEADAVEPSAAGYDAIRTGIEARRRRTWWLRGSTFAGAAVATAAAVVAFNVSATPTAIEQPPTGTISPSVSAAPSPAASTTPTVAPKPDSTPLGTIWPLTTHGELRAWQADRSTYPALSGLESSAVAFAKNYLLIADATVASEDMRDGSFFWEVRRGEQAVTAVTILEIKDFGGDGSGPYLVVQARSNAIEIERPAANGEVASPLAGHGTYKDVDPAINARLRADGPSPFPIELGDVRAVTGPPNVWDGSIGFTTTATTGSLMVTVGSLKDDGISAAAVVPIRFAASAAQPQAKTYAGIRDQRLGVFDAASGTLVRWLTEQEPGGGPSAPDVSPDGSRVAWSQGAGTCGATAFYVPVTGGERVRIGGAGEASGGVASSPTWVGNGQIAFAQTVCGSSGDTTTLRLYDVAAGTTRTLATLPGSPTQMAGSHDGKHLAYLVDGALRWFAIATSNTTTIPLRSGCQWRAVEIAGTTTTNQPILLTAETCQGSSVVNVDRFAPSAPDRDRAAEVAHDAMFYWLSYDPADSSLLVSHGVEDAPPYVERINRDGTKKVVGTNVDQARW